MSTSAEKIFAIFKRFIAILGNWKRPHTSSRCTCCPKPNFNGINSLLPLFFDHLIYLNIFITFSGNASVIFFFQESKSRHDWKIRSIVRLLQLGIHNEAFNKNNLVALLNVHLTISGLLKGVAFVAVVWEFVKLITLHFTLHHPIRIVTLYAPTRTFFYSLPTQHRWDPLANFWLLLSLSRKFEHFDLLTFGLFTYKQSLHFA